VWFLKSIHDALQAREQADSFSDFVQKEQKRAKSVISKTVEKIENDAEASDEDSTDE
jgi:hypothetical protein